MSFRVVASVFGLGLAFSLSGCSSADSDGGPTGAAGTGGSVAGVAGVGGAGGTGGGSAGTGGSAAGTAGTAGSAAGTAGSAAGTGGTGGGGGGTNGGGGSGGGGHQFSIRFDYRLDKLGYFAAPARRAALEAAGAVWSKLIHDDFAPVPKGTTLMVRNPENRDEYVQVDDLEEDIDDVLVFVGTSEAIVGLGRGGASLNVDTTDAALIAALEARRGGADFQPWAGSISFKASTNFFFDATPQTSDDIPPEAYDFITNATHELGHVLGFGAIPAFTAFVSGETFTGPHAVAAFGGPVPLTPDGTHFASHTQSGGGDTLMDPGQSNGTRSAPTPLDLAVLADIGYQVTP